MHTGLLIASFTSSIWKLIATKSTINRTMVIFDVTTKVDTIQICEETWRNSTKVSQLSKEGYTEKEHHSRQTFDRIIQLFRDTNSFIPWKGSYRKAATGEHSEISSFAVVANNPRKCCRRIERCSDIPNTNLWRVLRRGEFHSFRMSS